MKRWIRWIGGPAIGAAAVALTLGVIGVTAQPLTPGPGPEEERLPAMTRELRDMHRDMERMRGAMHGEGARAMRERMDGMAKRMERMAGMMERHQRRLESGCPALAPKAP